MGGSVSARMDLMLMLTRGLLGGVGPSSEALREIEGEPGRDRSLVLLSLPLLTAFPFPLTSYSAALIKLVEYR